MTITARGLNRATLARQLLLRREPIGVPEAVRHLLALQAQQPASPYLALWARLEGFDPTELDEALADATLCKATSLRITLHALHGDDHPMVHAAMQPTLRGARLGDRRFTSSGLTPADADALVPGLLAFATEPRTTTELQGWLREQVGDATESAWWALRSYAPLRHAVTGGPWSFGYRPSYVAVDGAAAPGSPDDHLPALVRRYLGAFGPATVADIARFLLVQRSRVRAALEVLEPDLERLEGEDGQRRFDLPDAPRPPDDAPAPPRLLPMWDSMLLAYADRDRIVPEPHRGLVTRRNGDVLPTVLVDGFVAGVWRPRPDHIEVTAFEPIPDDAWTGLAAEADGLLAFLREREPTAYARYGHWWDKLPPAEVRRLADGSAGER